MKIIIATPKKGAIKKPIAFLTLDRIDFHAIEELMPLPVQEHFDVREIEGDEIEIAKDEADVLSYLRKATPR